MPMVFIETKEEFAERNGGVCYPIPNGNGDKVFSTGAVSGPSGSLEAPPEGSEELTQMKYVFLESKLHFLTVRYESLRRDLVQTVSMLMSNVAVMPPEDSDFELLKTWAAEIGEVQRQRDKAHAELPGTKRANAIERKKREKQAAAQKLVNRLSGLPAFEV